MKGLLLILIFLIYPYEKEQITYRVLFIGDSLTVGYNTLHEDAAPSHQIPDTSLYDKINLGEGGIRMAWLDSIVGEKIVSNKNISGETILVIQIGINDLGHGDYYMNVYTCLKDFCIKYQKLGYKILVATLPSSSPDYGGIARIDYNTMIRNNYHLFSNGLVDLGSNEIIGMVDSYKNSEYFCDVVHMTYKGYGVIASIMNKDINNYITNLSQSTKLSQKKKFRIFKRTKREAAQ